MLMAERGTDIVSVAEARRAMRLVGVDVEHDALIDGYLNAAAEWVEQAVGLGVVDKVRVETALAVRACPIHMFHRSEAIRDLSFRDARSRTAPFVPTAVESTGVPGETLVPVPTGGWPSEQVELLFTQTTPAARVPGALRAAIVMLARTMYDLEGQIPAANVNAVNQLIMPYRDMRLPNSADMGPSRP